MAVCTWKIEILLLNDGLLQALAEAGATICVGTWPPVLGIFKASLDAGKMAEDLKTSTGGAWNIEKVNYY